MADTSPARFTAAGLRTVYTWIAPVYDLLPLAVALPAYERAIELADVRDGCRILEAGVGTGLLFERITRRNPNGWNVGIDPTPAMLHRAARRMRRHPGVRYRLEPGDLRALGFGDGSFDVVFSSYVLDLLPGPDLDRALGECYRVLRPGGRLVVVNMTNGARPAHRVWGRAARAAPILLGGARGIEVSGAMTEAGFDRMARHYVTRLGFPSEVVVAEKDGA